MTSARRSFDQRGFTLIEVMAAALVLVLGTLGMVALIDGANATTSSTKAREQGVNLQREIIEAARSVPYSQLTPTSVVSKIQATTGLDDSNLSSPGWTIKRRGVTYTVSSGVCSVDDTKDGTATHDAATFCASGAGMTTAGQCRNFLGVDGSIQGSGAAAAGSLGVGDCGIDLNLDGTVDNLVEASVDLCALGLCIAPTGTDKNPDDYKRVVTLVRWDRGSGVRYALQSSTISNPGLSAGPALASLTSLPSSSSQIGPGVTSIAFTATALQAPYTVNWMLDGTPQGSASGTGLGPWTFPWNLGSVGSPTPASGQVMDGTYVVGAKGYDRFGVYGNTKALTFSINRRQPYAPTGFAGGHNGSVIDFEWSPNRERDLAGYRVYRTTNGTAVVCTLTPDTDCQDTNPPGSFTISYYVVAVDKDSAGALREGDHSATLTVNTLNNPPNAPTNLTATSAGSNTVLSWSAPAIQDPNLGDSIAFYRIYRDGALFADRYDRTASNETSWTDSHTGGTTHTYRITAVDTQLAESTIVGPVTR
jgi:prepilin-type N-terminal cleavage/methylation domain-containing protein